MVRFFTEIISFYCFFVANIRVYPAFVNMMIIYTLDRKPTFLKKERPMLIIGLISGIFELLISH